MQLYCAIWPTYIPLFSHCIINSVLIKYFSMVRFIKLKWLNLVLECIAATKKRNTGYWGNVCSSRSRDCRFSRYCCPISKVAIHTHFLALENLLPFPHLKRTCLVIQSLAVRDHRHVRTLQRTWRETLFTQWLSMFTTDNLVSFQQLWGKLNLRKCSFSRPLDQTITGRPQSFTKTSVFKETI